MLKKLNPKIEMFSPFKEPFVMEKESADYRVTKFTIVSPNVIDYMKDTNTKIVAKCTPCQCCACR